jgi:hypothetical protein
MSAAPGFRLNDGGADVAESLRGLSRSVRAIRFVVSADFLRTGANGQSGNQTGRYWAHYSGSQ